jgi:class 3 adenylate cyclase
MGAVFLQEVEASVVMFDLRGFSLLAAQNLPLDLGAALGAFYEQVEACVLSLDGRVVRFMADRVLAAFLASQAPDHRHRALLCAASSHSTRPAWLEKNTKLGLPTLDYSLAVASGTVLAGQIGTERLRFFDILGEPVNVAHKLTPVATARGLEHLIAGSVLDGVQGPSTVEVEGIEIGGKTMRLFRLS